MTALAYAPPSFLNPDGQRVIFVHFTHAKYHLEFDVRARTASAHTQITFSAYHYGLAAISLNQPVISASLNHLPVQLHTQYSPDGQTSFKVLSLPVSPGSHSLAITSELTKPGPYGHPITWLSDPASVECVFHMSDLRFGNGGYLEAFLPSNHNFDQFRMSLSVAIFGTSIHHTVFTNGATSDIGPGRWIIEFPSFYNSSCPWFHLGPHDKYQTKRPQFPSRDGRTVPITIYSEADRNTDSLLEQFHEKTDKILTSLETDFGPFPHGSLTIHARKQDEGGMEYAGATSTELDYLRHELDHSYFGRSILPVNGDAGWIDEAIAKWGDSKWEDSDYGPSRVPPRRSSNMGHRSEYIRTTHRDAYSIGRDFLSHVDHVLSEHGGPKQNLRAFLAIYAERKRHQPVTATEFQELLEDYHGKSLQQLFETYVYGKLSTS